MEKNFSWDVFVQEIQKEIPQQQYTAWLEQIRFVELNENTLTISAPTKFSKEWIHDHFEKIFLQILKEKFSLFVGLSVEIREEESVIPETSFEENYYLSDPVATISVKELTTPIIKTRGEPINPKNTFENFIVGSSNQFAHAAAQSVAEKLAQHYNPLFLYSSAGLGKTHLLHAIGNYVLNKNSKSKILYISAETFVNELITSIRRGPEKMLEFRDKYRTGFDVLLMDDIQFIAGKDKSQEEFFHTFNTLRSSNLQIVVTSDAFPKEIQGLDDRVRTRLECGLVADIKPPEIETRIAILRAKAEQADLFLPNDVALFLASNIKSSVRELEGALLKLSAQADLLGVEISLDLTKQELSKIIASPLTAISADSIIESVANYFSIKPMDLKSKERTRRVALPRQICMYLLRKYCSKSYPEIGLVLGGKDHSTVLHGVKIITSSLNSNPDVQKYVNQIQGLL